MKYMCTKCDMRFHVEELKVEKAVFNYYLSCPNCGNDDFEIIWKEIKKDNGK